MLAKAEGLGGMTEDALRRQTEWNEGLVRKGGLEPPRYCYRQPLKLVRLPIPPLPQVVSGVWGPDSLRGLASPVEGPDATIEGIAHPAGAGHDS